MKGDDAVAGAGEGTHISLLKHLDTRIFIAGHGQRADFIMTKDDDVLTID